MLKKIISHGEKEQARQKLFAGAKRVADIVGSTLGPYGRPAAIQRKYETPFITDDGVSVARHILLEDVEEDIGAQLVIHACMATNDKAGDGTTTAALITGAIVRKVEEGMIEIGGGDVVGMAAEIESEHLKAQEILKSKARPLGEDELEHVIATSTKRKDLVPVIFDVMKDLGQDGYVSVEENFATKYGVDVEKIKGARYYGTYVTPHMVTNEKKEAVWDDSHVLVCNHAIQSMTEFAQVVVELRKQNIKKIIVISSGGGEAGGSKPAFSESLITQLALQNIAAKQDNPKATKILAIKAPSLTTEELSDLATYVGATFIDKKAGGKLETVNIDHLGFVGRCAVNEDEFALTGGKGEKMIELAYRIAELKEQAEKEKDQMFKNKLLRRISSLASGVAIIRVGAATETESDYLRMKCEDAVNAAKAAWEEGVLKGGGLALKEVAEELGTSSILYEPLMTPYKKIQMSAPGQELEIKETILDPLKVVRLALQNACSIASKLIQCDTIIADKERSMIEEMAKKFWDLSNDGDWRAKHNQDKGTGRIIE